MTTKSKIFAKDSVKKLAFMLHGSFGIEKHYTNLKHLLSSSQLLIKISAEMLKEKYEKISVLLQQLTY